MLNIFGDKLENNLPQNMTATTIIMIITVTNITIEKIDPISAMKIITLQEDRYRLVDISEELISCSSYIIPRKYKSIKWFRFT
jgi:hypothetical protein